MNQFMGFNNDNCFESIFEFARKEVEKQKHYYDAIALTNTEKVISAFRKHQVSDFYMKPSTGYAYNDLGRENWTRFMRMFLEPKQPWYVHSLYPEPMPWLLPCWVTCIPVTK